MLLFFPSSQLGKIPLASEEKIRPTLSRSQARNAPTLPQDPAGSKGRIFLIDAMSFIFRAYHAMGQRPMSTKTGIPTGATFVFVNMLRKLRADFHPQF